LFDPPIYCSRREGSGVHLSGKGRKEIGEGGGEVLLVQARKRGKFVVGLSLLLHCP